MSGRAVSRQLRVVVRPALQAVGFGLFTDRTAWRVWDEGIDVVNVQSFNRYLADGLGCTTFSFGLNLGVHFSYIPPLAPTDRWTRRDHLILPQEYVCPLRRALHKTLVQPAFPRSDIWFVETDGSNLAAAVEDARQALLRDGLPWFERFREPSRVLDLLRFTQDGAGDGTFGMGSRPSPMRSFLTAYAARRCGERDLAIGSLEQCLGHDTLAWAHEQIRRDITALREG